MSPRRASVALGTAQFGMGYGLSNCRLDDGRILEILGTAYDNGIRDLDTAPAYDDAEERLGYLLDREESWRIHTKISSYSRRTDGVSAQRHVVESLERSLSRLGVERVAGLRLHDCNDLRHEAAGELIAAMQSCRQRGLVEAIGASVYTADDVDAMLASFAPDVVQLPLSALDQRPIHEGTLRLLADRRVTIEVRSVLLQGLLAMAPGDLPARFRPHADHLRRFLDAAASHGLQPAQLAFSFARSVPHVDRVVLGVESGAQLETVLRPNSYTLDLDVAHAWSSRAPDLIDPRMWSGS